MTAWGNGGLRDSTSCVVNYERRGGCTLNEQSMPSSVRRFQDLKYPPWTLCDAKKRGGEFAGFDSVWSGLRY